MGVYDEAACFFDYAITGSARLCGFSATWIANDIASSSKRGSRTTQKLYTTITASKRISETYVKAAQ
jgi:hypothetical protein